MQSIQNIEEKIFTECKILIDQLVDVATPTGIIQQFQDIVILHEKAILLKNLELIQNFAKEENTSTFEQNDLEISNLEAERELLKTEYWQILEEKNAEIDNLAMQLKNSQNHPKEELIVEKPKDLVENILLGDYESQMPETNSPVEEIAEIISENPEVFQEEYNSKQEELEVAPETKVSESDEMDTENSVPNELSSERDDHLRQIIDFDKKEINPESTVENHEDFASETVSEKKFRLGKIKGLSMVKSLFDDDFETLEAPAEDKKDVLQKSNMATDYMEAEKPKQNFRVDLNDKVAFTKLLFKGDEDELRRTVNQLNEYKTLDEAKEYLSELYYSKEWDKVDDYAQRLWVLVENKFV